MQILGIDPGLSTAGIGLIDVSPNGTMSALDWLSIETSPALPLEERLLELGKDFETFLDEVKPELAVVEELFFATNKKSAMDTAQARGVFVLLLKRRGIPVMSATPLQLKSAIAGDGKADKRQVQEMVMRTLKMKELPTPVDAADALGLAIYGAVMRKTRELPPVRHSPAKV